MCDVISAGNISNWSSPIPEAFGLSPPLGDFIPCFFNSSFGDPETEVDARQQAAKEVSGRHLVYITMIVYSVAFVFGVFGNTLVIFVIVKYSAIRNKSISNYYILNLASADELFLMTVPFFLISTYTSDWMFGDAVCKLAFVFRESNKFAGVLTLMALSVDRCLATYPSTRRFREIKVGVGVCAAVWIVSLLACAPYFVHARTVVGHHGRLSCRLDWPPILRGSGRRAWTYSQLVAGLVVPFVVIAGANAVLVVRLRQRMTVALARRRRSSAVPGLQAAGGSGAGSDGSGGGGGGGSYIGSVTMARLIFVVVLIFLGCHLPYHVIEVLALRTHEQYTADRKLPNSSSKTRFAYIYAVSQLLVFVSSCCNPIIYGIFNVNYRHLYMKVLCCRRAGQEDRRLMPTVSGLRRRRQCRKPRRLSFRAPSRVTSNSQTTTTESASPPYSNSTATQSTSTGTRQSDTSACCVQSTETMQYLTLSGSSSVGAKTTSEDAAIAMADTSGSRQSDRFCRPDRSPLQTVTSNSKQTEINRGLPLKQSSDV